MKIRRDQPVETTSAERRIRYVLDQLQRADGFDNGIDWGTTVAGGVTIEELIGAVQGAEKELLQDAGSGTEER